MTREKKKKKKKSETRMTASVPKQDPNTYKSSEERLFIMTQTHSLQIFGGNPLAKLQNDT